MGRTRSMSMTRSRETSRVEVTSDGTRENTDVWLVIVDNEGHEMRYRIPCVLSVKYEIGNPPIHSMPTGVLTLGLGDAHLVSTIDIGGNKGTTIEDLMAEIAAARLRSSDR